MSVSCGPAATIPVLDSFPESLLRVLGGHRRLTVQLNQGAYETTPTFLEALEEGIKQRRYFLSLDRRESQPGGFAETPGQMRGVGLLLLVDFPRRPDYSCSTFMTSETHEICVQWEKKGKNLECKKKQKITTNIYHALDTIRLWTVANLMSVETSRSLVVTHHAPQSVHRTAQNTPISCLGFGALSIMAEKQAAQFLSTRVSPTIVDYRVPLLNDTQEVRSDLRVPVRDLLDEGILAFSMQPERAVRIWHEALDRSEKTSASAFWNLAVYQWSVRNLKEAQASFDAAFASGGLEWLTKRRRETFNRFYREKTLVEKQSIEGL